MYPGLSASSSAFPPPPPPPASSASMSSQSAAGGPLSSSSSSSGTSLEALLAGLPYPDKGRLLADLSSLLSQTNSLSAHLSPAHPSTSSSSPSGSSAPSSVLLALTGTLPIFYRSSVYHIPVSLYLPSEYPFRPPSAYVTPTKDMRIKERHKHVDSAGVVYLPYLHHWGADSGLVELVSVMASVFSEDPPVFKVHSAQSQSQLQGQVQAMGLSAESATVAALLSSTASPSSSLSLSQSHGAALSPVVQLSPSSLSPSPEPQSPASAQRARLLASLTRKAQDLLRAQHAEASVDMDSLLAAQEQVRARRQRLDQEMQLMDAEARQLEDARTAMQAKRAELLAWLQQHDGEQHSVDELVWCRDTWSAQLLSAVAMDVALDDTMTALDRALSEGALDCERFVKLLRGLSRQQYFTRALATRLQQRQGEARQSPSMQQQPPQQQQQPALAAGGRR